MRVAVNVLLRNPQTGEVTFIEAGSDAPEWAADMLDEHAVDDSGGEGGYESMTVADLRAEIESRNEGREEVDLIPSDGKKADLVAALDADDDN